MTTGEGKTTYMFSVSVNAFSVEFPLACYQQAGRVWYVSGALRRTYTLFYATPMTTEYLQCCFYLQNRLIQTNQIGGQRYSDTSPLSIPCFMLFTLDIRSIGNPSVLQVKWVSLQQSFTSKIDKYSKPLVKPL